MAPGLVGYCNPLAGRQAVEWKDDVHGGGGGGSSGVVVVVVSNTARGMVDRGVEG